MIANISFGDIIDWIEAISPFLLLALFTMDIAAFILSCRENKQRRHHIRVIRKNIGIIKESTEILSRRNYELAIREGVETAKKRILCYWHSLHPVAGSENYEKINTGLIEKTGEDGVKVQVVIASDPSRIAPAYELVQKGVDVRFKNSLTVSDLRFSIFDDKMCVFGLPEASAPDGKPSRHGFDISSHKLNAILAEYFEAEVDKNFYGFYKFVAFHSCEVLKEPTNSIAMVAEQLRVPESVIEEACPEQCKKKREEEKEKEGGKAEE